MDVRLVELGVRGKRFAGSIAALSPTAGDVELPSPISFALQVNADATRITVRGWVHSSLKVPCARCLEAVERIVHRKLDLTFKPADSATDDSETELDEADLDTDYYADGVLSLRPVLTEQVLLEVPIKSVCDDACRGLCPQCGTNRNLRDCDCQPAVDPRLSPLAALRDEL